MCTLKARRGEWARGSQGWLERGLFEAEIMPRGHGGMLRDLKVISDRERLKKEKKEKRIQKPGMVDQAFNSITWDAEAGGY